METFSQKYAAHVQGVKSMLHMYKVVNTLTRTPQKSQKFSKLFCVPKNDFVCSHLIYVNIIQIIANYNSFMKWSTMISNKLNSI